MKMFNRFFEILRSKKRIKEVVIIHTMGKVGSSSMQSTIKSFYNGKVFHTHFLNRKRFSKHYDSLMNKGLKIHEHIKQSELLIEKWDKIEKFKIVCLIREPIGRNISAYFQNMNEVFLPNFMENSENSINDINKLVNSFLKEYPHDLPLNWLDWEINQVFGVDFHSMNFPKTKGYKIVRKNNCDILLLRMDKIDSIGKQALSNFFEIEEESIVFKSENVASNKSYNKYYIKFKESINLPDSYIKKMYSSNYTKHFFSQDEIEVLKNKYLVNQQS